MPIPFAAALAGTAYGIGATIADYALGKPLSVWGRSIDAANTPAVRTSSYLSNKPRPNVLPSPDALLMAWRQGLISDDDVAYALSYQGIFVETENRDNQVINFGIGGQLTARNRDYYGKLWNRISLSGMSRPDPASIFRAAVRGRLDEEDTDRLTRNVFADWNLYRRIELAQYQQPGINDLWQLWKLGRISAADYQVWARRLGWTNREALDLAQRASALPTVPELMLGHYRGTLTWDMVDKYLQAGGMSDWLARQTVLTANRQLPGPSDLVRFAIREAWDDETAQAWGYDEEFPYPFERWMQWYGQNWGQAFQGPDGRNYAGITWPKAYWRSHWQIMAPTQAYRALHLLRPDQIRRYQELSPGVTPFTTADMTRVLKVSDYPPKMRAWLQAIAFAPMRLVDIRNAYNLKVRNREWALNRLLDRGQVREDATTTIELWDAQNLDAQDKAARAYLGRFTTERIAENRRAYRMGAISKQALVDNFQAMGIDTGVALLTTDFEDSVAAREGLQEFVKALRRQYLAGAIALPEVALSLQAARISQSAIARYSRRWQAQLSLERRELSTSQVARLVSMGALTPADGATRLVNLGWNAADSALLIQQAAAQLAERQAVAARSQAARERANAASLVSAQAKARQALRSAQGQLRGISPVSTLKRWYCLGIRTGSWIEARLAAMGYDSTSISAYLSQWAQECESKPSQEAPAVDSAQSLVKRQTSLATVKAWWQNGVVTDEWARQRLSAAGYTPESIAGYIDYWRATLGKKPGPKARQTAQA